MSWVHRPNPEGLINKQDRFTTCFKTCVTKLWTCVTKLWTCVTKLWVFWKVQKKMQKMVQMFQEIFHKGAGCHQTCFQTSGNRIPEIWPNFYVVCTLFPGFWGQGVHFWGQKSKNIQNYQKVWKRLKCTTLYNEQNILKTIILSSGFF